jgi:hydroxyacylglutathione hydrolase
MNEQSSSSVTPLNSNELQTLELKPFKAELEAGAQIIDVRPADVFTHGFIPSSISIGLEGRLSEWATTLIPLDTPILLVAEPGSEQDAATQLQQHGFTHIIGYLSGGFAEWAKANEPIDMIIDIEADELKMDLNYDPKMVVMDVRTELEFQNGHVQTAVHTPLNTLTDVTVVSQIEETDNIYVYCRGGYRSVIAASLLKREGIHNLRNVLGGYEAIKLVPDMPLVAARETLN